MRRLPKSAVVGFLIGVVVGAGLMFLYHAAFTPTDTYRSVVGHLHFLIREGDAASARAALERHVPFYVEQDMSTSQWRALQRDLQDASRKHVE